jgi:curli biogenesis system outer membrane secretion channel CsgG
MKKGILLILLMYCSLCMYGQSLKGYIIKIDGERIYLDLHAPDVKVSDLVSVHTSGETVIHPVTKAKIRTEGETLGTLKITQVYDSYSTAKILPGVAVSALKEGLEVRKIVAEAEEKPVLPDGSVISLTTPSPATPATSPVASQPATPSPVATVAPVSDGKMSVVVAPAEVNDVVNAGHFGSYVADILMEQLLMGDKVRLLDRSVLNAQIDEVQLSGEYIDPNTAIQRGKIAGAQYIIQVTMQKPDVVNIHTGIPLASFMGAVQAMSGVNTGAQYMSNMQTGTLKAAVNISTRVIDLETGEVIFMCSGKGNARGKSQLSLESGALGGMELNGGADGFKQTITGKAIQQAFTSIGRNLNGYFAGNVNKKVIGSAGGGVRYGDELYVKGSTLFLGVEKMNMESAQTLFADNPDLFFNYRSAKRKIGMSKFCNIMGGIVGVGGLMFIVDAFNSEGGERKADFMIGFSALAIGGTGAYLGITLTRKGRAQLRNLSTDYNRSQIHSYRNTEPSLQLTTASRGIGIGLRLTF